MPADLTAILLPLPPRGHQPNEVLSLVAQSSPAATWLRLCPFPQHEIHQLEVLDGQTGLPAVSPAMLVALSQNGGKALFVHVNHQGGQALLHAFEDGIEVASHSGAPSEAFHSEFQRLVGHTVDEIVAADDGTRAGFGQAASRTAALVRGRLLLAPAGTPTSLGSFNFHDRGHDRNDDASEDDLDAAERSDEHEDGADSDADATRAAFFAFDGNLIQQAFNDLPGKQLAQVIGNAPQEVLGPLFGLRDDMVQELNRLETPPGKSDAHPAWHTHAFEILALCHTGIYGGGDTLHFLDQKLLALLSIGDATPIIDADDAEELEELPSVIDAMVEVLPCPKPPGGYGPLMELIGPEEIGALVPWAKPGEPYDGAIFLIKPERLLHLVRGLDGSKLSQRLERFCRALYTAGHGEATDEQAYVEWRKGIEERSRPDIERFLTGWAELRIVLELAATNKLHIGLLIYG
jgi:hypothetical protein